MATNEKIMAKRADVFPAIFEDFFKPWNEWFNGKWHIPVSTIPAVNIMEAKDMYIVKLGAPGLKKEDFKIDVNDNFVSISVKTESDVEESDYNFTRKEYNYSSFSRTFTLPETIDQGKIVASYENGELKLKLPKKVGAIVNKQKNIVVN